MNFFADRKALLALRDDVRSSGAFPTERPQKIDSLRRYFGYMGYSLKLMVQEPELILFTVLQWLSVAAAYYLFVMMLYWIPPDVWKSTERSDSGSIADLVLWVWIIICIGLAALPLGIFSSCIAVVHMLRYYEEKPSSIAYCLKIVLPRAWSLWIFHWIDGYITISQIIERLPKKNDRTPLTARLAGEVLYYTWKITTMGILPNLITGRSVKDTCGHTIGMIREHGVELLRIRTGYSVLCWIIAIATYIWGIYNFGWIKERFFPGALEDTIAQFYFVAGIPVLFSVAVIQLVLRPAYIIALTDVYGTYMLERNEVIIKTETPRPAISALVIFLLLCLAVGAAWLHRYELGIMDMLATPYGQSYKPQHGP